ncbi:CapA family protein [Paramesorhizobium deserti]|uniref:CapA family protein n=1 Tax=Paramesorhizobium deserti TaxID=1494590 RepID=UPI000B1C4BBE|nr:CapA family protein [Paramesorhizobium deserti]
MEICDFIKDEAEKQTENASEKYSYSKDVLIAWGGDVNLGRGQHYITNEIGIDNVLNIAALREADLSIVNLECVVSTLGTAGVEKGESGPYYYRARPEMLQVLRQAGIHMVAVANNHSGDYGSEALMEQSRWLTTFGLKFAGSGHNISEAFSPAYSQAGPFRVAMFSIDATQRHFAATDNSAGIAYLDMKRPGLWLETLTPLISEARSNADIVLVAVHWGKNWATIPDDAEIAVGHAIIDAGADAILGASAHVLQGIEVYKGKPIIHDAGNLLFDSKRPERGAGVFRLHVDRKGIRAVSFVPVRVAFGRSYELRQNEAIKVSAAYRDLCLQLGTDIALEENGWATLIIRESAGYPLKKSTPTSMRHVISEDAAVSALAAIGIRDEWTATDIPVDARLSEPICIGPLALLGFRCKPRNLSGRAMLWVESFWTCDEKLTADWRLDIRAISTDKGSSVVWGAGMDHDPCDWMLPTSRWQPQQVYRDYFALRPPASKTLRNTDLVIEICLINGNLKTDSIRVPNSVVRIKLPSPTSSSLNRPSFARPAISRDQRPAIPIENCQYSFLNVDMGVQRTGVENASLLRAVLFTQELGISPRILTSKYNPQLRYAEECLRLAGQLPRSVPLHNMYDYYQEAEKFDQSKGKAADLLKPELNPTQVWKSIPRTNDHRVFNERGEKLMYVARRENTGKIAYVNHFRNNIKWRRDVYDWRGFISSVQILDENNANIKCEMFMRPDGSIALSKNYSVYDGQSRLYDIQIIGRNGILLGKVKTEDELMTHWLNEYVGNDKLNHVFFVDKSRVLYKSAVDARDLQSDTSKVTVIPIVHALHTRSYRQVEHGPENRNYTAILQEIQRPDAIVVLTEEQKADIIKRYGAAPISVIGHAYNSSMPPSDFKRRDRYKVVYLARYSPEKNHQMAIRAFKQVVSEFPNASLHCYGFGNSGDPTLPSLQKLVQEQGLGSNVFLNGWAQDAASIYESAGLAILTSQSEAFSLTIMESLCHGCPVVAFDVRYGPGALIRHGYNGFLVPFGDEAEFAQSILKVLRNESLHLALSAQARRDAERFSTKQMARSWSKLLTSLSIGTHVDQSVHLNEKEEGIMNNVVSNDVVKSTFSQIFHKNAWRGPVPSGPGSSLQATAKLRPELMDLFRKLHIRTLCDSPCGDLTWIPEITHELEFYLGVDVVNELIAQHTVKGYPLNHFFTVGDITTQVLPTVDAILCRDCLVHFPLETALRTLALFKSSGSRYLMTTTFTDRTENAEMKLGGWRPLNLEKAPFNLPPPIALIRERHPNVKDRYNDKSLGVWELGSLQV